MSIIILSATNLMMLFAYLQYKPFFCTLTFYSFFLHPLYSCFMITDIGAHKFRLFAPFVMNIEIVLSGLDCTLCLCSSCQMIICRCIKMSVLFSVSQSCLYITCDMIYVIHGNKITFIVIVIVSYHDNVMSISEENRDIGGPGINDNYQHRCLNATGNTCSTHWGWWEIYALVTYASLVYIMFFYLSIA